MQQQNENENEECKVFDTYIPKENHDHGKKVDSEIINKIEDYTEIIPQKIKSTSKEEKILNINKENENIEDNYDTQNLDFSFGKTLKLENKTDENIKNITDLKKIVKNNIPISNDDKKINDSNPNDKIDNNINGNNDKDKNNNQNDIVEKREILSENLSNHQLADSISHFFDNNFEGNKKLKLIKEKFVSNFKNKERGESLEKALILFDKYSNYGKFKLNRSFTNRYDNPFKSYQNGNISEKNDKNEISYIKRKKYSVNNLEINGINNPNEKNDKNDNKIILKKMVNRKKIKKKSTYEKLNLKNEKKNGYFIRKVIREEKYFIDNEGKEKLIGIKQSIFDSQNDNENGGGKMININKNKSFKNNQSKTLLNSKKISEIIKGKISNKKELDNKGSFSLKNNISKSNIKNKNIELVGNKILQKKINGDKCNNIKIVINKINKINSNPKINLNFIKKYRNNKKNNNQNNISTSNLNKNDNNGNKTFHLIKVDKFKNENEPTKITSNFHQYKNLIYNYSSNVVQRSGYSGKDKLKIVKCEKFDDNKKIGKKYISNNDIYFSNQRFTIQNNQRTISNKRNYSFKEVRNLSNNSKKNDSKKIFEKYNNNNRKYLTIDAYSHVDKNKYKSSRTTSNINEQNIFNNTNRNNHTFYESKSFSSKKKINQRFKNEKEKILSYGNRNESSSQMNSINIDENKNNETHSVYFYQYATNNFGTKRNNMNIINNNNIYNINTSFNTNIYSYNNGS